MKHFVEFWLSASARQQKGILLTLTKKQLKFLTEIIYNVVRGTIPVSDKDKKTLTKHKNVISAILTKRISLQERRKRIQSVM